MEITYPLPEGTSAGLLSFVSMGREGRGAEGRGGEGRGGEGGREGGREGGMVLLDSTPLPLQLVAIVLIVVFGRLSSTDHLFTGTWVIVGVLFLGLLVAGN